MRNDPDKNTKNEFFIHHFAIWIVWTSSSMDTQYEFRVYGLRYF